MSKLLYYPSISIPDLSWLPKALLYWDGIATIASLNYLRNPSRFPPFMRTLLKEELIEVVTSDGYARLYSEEYGRFFDWAIRNAHSFSRKFYKHDQETLMSMDLYVGKLGYGTD